MRLDPLPEDFSVCKLDSLEGFSLRSPFYFLGKTDEELSLVCRTEDVPKHTLKRDDGWRAFRIAGTLDFSLIGILSRLTGLLAEQGIGVFAVSTYNTDYILVKQENFSPALNLLSQAGYEIKKR